MFTVAELAELSANPDPAFYHLADHREALVPEMHRADIVTPRRVRMFLANVLVETDGLKTLEEYGNEAYYRSFLGSQWRFHGRGYLMNTWRASYARLSRHLHVDLLKNPDLLSTDKKLAARAAVWYWTRHGLNHVADTGNFLSVCSIINRGEVRPTGPVNGWAQRLAFFERAQDVLMDDGPHRTKPRPLHPPHFKPLPVRPGNYQDRHPTRYAFRPDVEGLIRRLYRKFGRKRIHCNTYAIHPEDDDGGTKWARDTAAFDVWNGKGRNDPLDPVLGQEIFNYVFHDPHPPFIEWVIYRRKIYILSEGFVPKPFGTEPFSFHDDHIHFTFTGPFRLLS